MTQRPRRTDHQLKIEIAEELAWTPSVRADRIGVSVTDSAVTLSGEVLSYPEKAAATAAVLRIHGVTAVRAVHDDVALTPSIPVAPADAKAKITAALVRHARMDARHIAVAITDSAVTLTGTVSSAAERHQAEHAAWSTPGVVFVRNELTVDPEGWA